MDTNQISNGQQARIDDFLLRFKEGRITEIEAKELLPQLEKALTDIKNIIRETE